MTPRDKPPFRADYVGSLLRPGELIKAREDHAAGRIDDDALRAAEDEAIRDVVKLQRELGLRTATARSRTATRRSCRLRPKAARLPASQGVRQ